MIMIVRVFVFKALKKKKNKRKGKVAVAGYENEEKHMIITIVQQTFNVPLIKESKTLTKE